jgi:hypothetical protein
MPNLAELNHKIFKPEDFDAKCSSGGILLEPYQTLTTMPLSRFLMDLAKIDMDCEQWHQGFLTHMEKIGPFLRKKMVKKISGDPLEVFKDNRYHYGWQSGIKDVLLTEYPEAADVILNGKYRDMLYLGKKYPNHAPIKSREELEDLLQDEGTFVNKYGIPFEISIERIRSTAELMFAGCGDIETIDQVLAKASKRQGVQVLYGDDNYERYFASAPKHGGSELAFTWKLLERTPLSHALAIIPVGEYEQGMILQK